MDAVEYLKAKARMTKRGDGAVCNISCKDCPIGIDNNGVEINCRKLESYYPEKAVEIIKQWAAEHPRKTRQSEFLKMFPNAALDDGTIRTCPQLIEGEDNYNCIYNNGIPSCINCRKRYWLAEVDND